MLSKDKKEWFDLPTIERYDNDFKNKKFDKKMALGLLNEIQVHWCRDCDNYKHSGCGCYFPSFKKEMIKKINEHFGVKSEKELQNIYLNKPYKFEDLKPNMWVWDDLIKECVQLDEDCFEPDNVILILMRGNYGYRESTRTFFEENRFFPVQCANLES